jgi:hypothetical protein
MEDRPPVSLRFARLDLPDDQSASTAGRPRTARNVWIALSNGCVIYIITAELA